MIARTFMASNGRMPAAMRTSSKRTCPNCAAVRQPGREKYGPSRTTSSRQRMEMPPDPRWRISIVFGGRAFQAVSS